MPMHQSTNTAGKSHNRLVGRMKTATAAVKTAAKKNRAKCVRANFRKNNVCSEIRNKNKVSESSMGDNAIAVGFSANSNAAQNAIFQFPYRRAAKYTGHAIKPPRIADIATQKLKLPPLMNKQIARYNGYNGRRDAVGGAPGDEANTPFSNKLCAGPR